MTWERYKLGEICEFIRGPFGGSLKKNCFVENGFSVYEQQHAINNQCSNFRYFINQNKFREMSRFSVKPGDILMSCSGTIGKTTIVPKEAPEGIINQALLKITPLEIINVRYLKFYMESNLFKRQLMEKVDGAAIQNVASVKVLKEISIEIPSLEEQKSIIRKLDVAFHEINRAISINQNNFKNAKRIYSNGIDEIFGKFSGKNEKLGDYSKINYGYTTKASFEKGKYRFLRITDIQDNSVNWDKVPYCEIEEEKKEKMLLQDGDIVFARTGATTGKSFLVKNPVNAIFASYLIRVSLNREVFNPNYVMHFFQSTKYWQQVKAGISGSAQGGFNASKLSLLGIPKINKDEQNIIVRKLDSLNYQANRLGKIYVKKLAQYSALKSSLLSNMLIN